MLISMKMPRNLAFSGSHKSRMLFGMLINVKMPMRFFFFFFFVGGGLWGGGGGSCLNLIHSERPKLFTLFAFQCAKVLKKYRTQPSFVSFTLRLFVIHVYTAFSPDSRTL